MSTSAARAVERSVEVKVPVEVAWRVFTEEMATWWPLATHSLGADVGRTPGGVVLEGREGGEIYELLDGDRRPWGTVAEWSPPTRLGVDWTVGSGVVTRWTATFTAIPSGTRLDLVHDGFEAHGAREDELRTAYGDEGGWTLVLSRYADAGSEAG